MQLHVLIPIVHTIWHTFFLPGMLVVRLLEMRRYEFLLLVVVVRDGDSNVHTTHLNY